MADEKLITEGLDALDGLIGLVLEEALDQALARPPADAIGRLRRLADLRQAGADVVVLAEATRSMLRRWQGVA